MGTQSTWGKEELKTKMSLMSHLLGPHKKYEEWLIECSKDENPDWFDPAPPKGRTRNVYPTSTSSTTSQSYISNSKIATSPQKTSEEGIEYEPNNRGGGNTATVRSAKTGIIDVSPTKKHFLSSSESEDEEEDSSPSSSQTKSILEECLQYQLILRKAERNLLKEFQASPPKATYQFEQQVQVKTEPNTTDVQIKTEPAGDSVQVNSEPATAANNQIKTEPNTEDAPPMLVERS